ncbi:MAG: helix-turn-helix domain-containing protein [Bacteroidota bacterium]|nr:helix-turn-helix domain-containing protein [Bacteroidota bacterium]
MKQEIPKYLFNKNLPLQIEMVDLAKLIKMYGNIIYISHRTNFYHIFLFDQCTPKHMVDFNSVKVRPYSMLFINKDNVHLFDKSSRYTGKVLIFTDEFFCVTENDKNFLRRTIVFNDLLAVTNMRLGKSYTEFLKLFNELDNELQLPIDANQHQIVKNMLHNLLLKAERKKREEGFVEFKKGADLDYTLLFKDLLDEQFHHLKSVAAYADKLTVSEKRLNRATTIVLGKTPKQMIDERILLEAKRLLTHTSNSIKEIAFAIGFDEPTNFIKYFRKHTSQTPVDFRESYLRH